MKCQQRAFGWKQPIRDSCTLNPIFTALLGAEILHELLWAPCTVFAPPTSSALARQRTRLRLSTSRLLEVCPSATVNDNQSDEVLQHNQLTRQPSEPESVENEPTSLAKELATEVLQITADMESEW